MSRESAKPIDEAVRTACRQRYTKMVLEILNTRLPVLDSASCDEGMLDALLMGTAGQILRRDGVNRRPDAARICSEMVDAGYKAMVVRMRDLVDSSIDAAELVASTEEQHE